MPIFNGGRIGSNNDPFTGTKSDDPNYSDVSLLLNGNDLTDSSSHNHTLSNTNITVDTTTKKYGSGSLKFSTSAYGTFPHDTSFDIGTGDFTIEAWIYPQNSGTRGIAHNHPSFTGGGFTFWVNSNSQLIMQLFTNGSSSGDNLISTTTVPNGTWAHVAYSRSGGTGYLFVNGNLEGINTDSRNLTNNSAFYIGVAEGSNYRGIGYIDDLRFTVGVARYTGNFTPPTAQLPDLSDPDFSDVSLLLHGNGTDGSTTFTDSSSYGHTVTPVGNAQISTTQSKFGDASMYFDGSGDYLSIPSSNSFNFGSGDFTIEAWIYLTSYPVAYLGQYYIASIITKDSLSDGRSFTFNLSGTSTSWTSIRVTLFSSNSTYIGTSATTSFDLNTWYHVAAIRNGTSLRLYKNGVDVGGGTNATSVQNTATVVTVGSESPNFISYGNAYYFPGYIDDLRITKGVARYPKFTPPTAQLPGAETGTFASGVWTALEQCDAVRRVIWTNISVWTPTYEIASFSGWYDVSNTSSITESGEYVDQWSDLSGNSRTLNGYSSYKPQITSSYQLNGVDTLELDGSTMLHTSTQPNSSTGIQVASGLYHVIAVMKWNTPTGGYYVFSGRGPSGSGYDYHGPNSANIYDVRYTSSYVENAGHIINGGTSTTASSVQKQLNWHIYRIDFPTNDLGYWQGTGFDSRLSYGIRGFNGSIAEILLINQNVSGLAQKVEGYLAHKWGIESVLPVSHPYKSSPPKIKINNSSIVTDGLVVHLDAGDSASYPGSGTTWTDLSGNGNNGTINGATYDSANGGSLSFDGSNNYVNLGSFFTFSNFTISLWVYPGSTQTTYADIFDNNHTDSQNFVCQQNANNVNQYSFACLNGIQPSATSYFTLSANVWQYLTFTWNNSVASVYINGVFHSSGVAGSPINYVNPTLNIARWSSQYGGRHWNGRVSYFTAYNKALTPSEITQNFNALKGRYGL